MTITIPTKFVGIKVTFKRLGRFFVAQTKESNKHTINRSFLRDLSTLYDSVLVILSRGWHDKFLSRRWKRYELLVERNEDRSWNGRWFDRLINAKYPFVESTWSWTNHFSAVHRPIEIFLGKATIPMELAKPATTLSLNPNSPRFRCHVCWLTFRYCRYTETGEFAWLFAHDQKIAKTAAAGRCSWKNNRVEIGF